MMPMPQPYTFEQLREKPEFQYYSDKELKELPRDQRYSDEELGKFPNFTTPSTKRRPNAALLYVFADQNDPNQFYQTLDNIGSSYGVSREQIRMDKSNHLKDLNAASPQNVRVKYPFDSLNMRRPQTLSMTIDKSFASSRGVSTMEINQMCKEGMSAKEIAGVIGGNKLAAARIKLKEWGLQAPELIQRNFIETIKKIKDPATTIEELRELIKTFDNHTILRHYSRGKKQMLVPVSDLQNVAWGNKDTRSSKKIFQLLQDAGIPVHSISQDVKIGGKEIKHVYRFTLMRTKEEALRVLMDSSVENRHILVEQVAGPMLPPESTPNTYQLFGAKTGEWVSVASYTLGYGSGKKLHHLMQAITSEDSFPVSVVKYQSSSGKDTRLYIKKSYRDAFDKWLQNQKV